MALAPVATATVSMGAASPASLARGVERRRCRRFSPILGALAVAVVLRVVLSPDGVAFGKKWWPNHQRKYSKEERERIRHFNRGGVLDMKPPRNGIMLAPDKTNIAVEDREQLASEPLKLTADRLGRKLLPGDSPRDDIALSQTSSFGVAAATAPMSWEEFEARYRVMDKQAENKFGTSALDVLAKQFSTEDGQDNYRAIRTFSFQGEDGAAPTSIMLVGVTATSARSRQLAARVVYETEPTGLLVQLCRERIGRYLVMPSEHLATVANYARGFATANPHRINPMLQPFDIVNGDYEALSLWMSDLAYSSALDEFTRLPASKSTPKMLCLGDVRWSKLEALREQQGNHSMKERSTLSARGRQLARGLVALANMGHRQVVGVVHVDLLGALTNWLEQTGGRLMAVADASDIEGGRESLVADARMGLQSRPVAPPARLGAQSVQQGAPNAAEVLGIRGNVRIGSFLNEAGISALQKRKERLLRFTRVEDLVKHRDPPKVWRVAELIGGDGHIPGPEAELEDKKKGLTFEFEHLEIPDHYLRDAGMERYSRDFWDMLKDQDGAVEARDFSELLWWATEAGGRRQGVAAAQQGA